MQTLENVTGRVQICISVWSKTCKTMAFTHKRTAAPCLHIYKFTLVHTAGPFYICTCNMSLFTHTHPHIYAQPAGLLYKQQAPFIRKRLLAQFTVHISRPLIASTHIRRRLKYPHTTVLFTHANTDLFKNAQTVLFIHVHYTYANPNVALHIITLVGANECEPTWTCFNGPQAKT